MKMNYSFLSLFSMLLLFISCSERDDPGKYINWRERNEAFIDSLQQIYDLELDPELKALVYQRDKRFAIYYKVMKSIPEGQPPFYTSTVHYYFREMLIDEAIFNASPTIAYYTKLYEHLDVLKSNIKDDNSIEFNSPRKLDVKKFEADEKEMAAYTEIMQHMRVGERWEVYIPWQLAYGSGGASTAPGYSAVISDVILYKIDY